MYFSVILTVTVFFGLAGLFLAYFLNLADHKLKELKKFYTGTIPPISIVGLLTFGIAQWELDYNAAKINLEDPFSSPNAATFDSKSFKMWAREKLGRDSVPFKVF